MMDWAYWIIHVGGEISTAIIIYWALIYATITVLKARDRRADLARRLKP